MLKTTHTIAREVASARSIGNYSGISDSTRSIARAAAAEAAVLMFEQIREMVEKMATDEGPGDAYSLGRKAASKAILDTLNDSYPWMVIAKVKPSDYDAIVGYHHTERDAEREAERWSARNRDVKYTVEPTDDMPNEGIDLCACGSKYWDGNVCHSCGAKFKPEGSK